jgi:hypothetical protein
MKREEQVGGQREQALIPRTSPSNNSFPSQSRIGGSGCDDYAGDAARQGAEVRRGWQAWG